MAAQVNVKFIIIAGTVFTVVVGAGAWYAIDRIVKTGEERVALGDEAAARGDWKTARLMYSQAVFKDQGNIPWIEKWIEATRNSKPESRREYGELYFGELLLAMRGKADADRTNVEYFRDYLEQTHRRLTVGGGDLGAWEAQLAHVEDTLKLYRGDEATGGKIKRYRGLARLGLIGRQRDPSPETIEAARQDFTAAIAADPMDAESVQGLSAIDEMQAMNHRRLHEIEQAEVLEKSARDRLRDFIKAYPPAASSRLALLRLELSDVARSNDTRITLIDALKAQRSAVQQLVDATLAERGENLDPAVIISVAELAEISLESGANVADMLFTQALQTRPNDPQLMLTWGRFEMMRGNTEKAVERLQKIVDLPDPPISLDGIILQDFRGRAVSMQADAMFAAWERETTADGRAAFAERARQYRGRLASFVPENSAALLSLDARLKYIEGDLSAARKLLSDYNEQTGGRDALSVQLLAEVLLQQGSTGAARTNYERALELDPRSIRAMSRLGQMAADARDYASAVRYFEGAAAIAPNDAEIKAALQSARDLLAGADAKDPVAAIVNEVRALTGGVAPDLAKATEKVQGGLRTHPGDVRLSILLADLQRAQDNVEGAKQTIKAALAANPNDQRLIAIDRALNDPDPVGSALKAIDLSAVSDVVKHVERSRVLRGAGRAQEADAELAAAAKLDPKDPTVVELQFGIAAEKSDTAELDRLCRIAEEANLDQAKGAVYRARRDLIGLAKEQNREARSRGMESIAAGVRAALTADKLNPALWRMLGVVQMELGQTAGAVDSFKESVRIRPKDQMSNLYLVKAHLANRDIDSALAAARAAEPVCGRDPEFVQLLLMLETESPAGDRVKALQARQRLAQQKPEDLENKLSLVSLLLEANQTAEAEALVPEIMGKNARLGAAAKSAVLARKGDRAGAVAAYRSYLDSTEGGAKDVSEYVAAARFLAQVASVDDAIALLETARDKQSGQAMEVDRTIGDLCFDSGKSEKAIEAYGRVLEAGIADPDRAVLKRFVESKLRLQKFAEAEELIASVGEPAKGDMILLILAAQAAAGQGNTESARKSLDQAVAAAPENFLGYFKRAEFTASDPSRQRDTEADLQQALKLRPDLTAARRMLATLYFEMGRTEEGIEQVRKALAAAPADTQLRMDLVQLLLALSRTSEALDVLEDAVKTFPADLAWKLRAAQVFTQTGRFERSAQLVGDIFAKVPTPEMAELLVVSLTSGPSPNVTRAMEVLATPALKTEQNWRLLMSRARVWAMAPNKANEAVADAALAWSGLNQESADDMSAYFTLFSGVFRKPEDQATVLGQFERRGAFKSWGLYRATLARLNVPALEAQAESTLRQMGETTGLDPALSAAVWGSIGARAYRKKDFEGALLAFQRGLTYAPEDAELNNNVAYTLGVDLKRPTESLPFAERAARAAPSSPMILDTLGAIYLAIGQAREAEPVLVRAANLASNPGERIPALIHLGTARAKLGDKTSATQIAGQAKQLLEANAYLRDVYEASLKELLRTLDGQ